ncbi:hypothetical protein C8F04DRAFT_1149980 [Mycena alexandri]|uniref:Secreted protein n=1 Tax=Mycena alexandri TaxID=1745969 RepID=A0AAD6WLM3_9AGAR|nr:hypothetical protein C8F04DRAFT_1149980 [Mycena alexandri]
MRVLLLTSCMLALALFRSDPSNSNPSPLLLCHRPQTDPDGVPSSRATAAYRMNVGLVAEEPKMWTCLVLLQKIN